MTNILRSIIGSIGFQLRRSKLINLRGKIVHPLEMIHSNFNKRGFPIFLMDIPISKCRTQLWNTLEENRNPFVKTIIEYSKNKSINYYSATIKTYYQSYLPKNAGEVLRLINNHALTRIKSYGYTLPWDNLSVPEIIKIRERDALKENRRLGGTIGLSSGYTDFGPVDTEKGEIEFNRLVSIFENIKRNGYKEKPYLKDQSITGSFLLGENSNWCFIVKSGKHRAYALSALGFKNIPVVVDFSLGTMIRIAELSFWHQVANGTFSKDEAYTFATNMLNIEKSF